MFLETSWTWIPENLYRKFITQVVAQDAPFGLITFNYDTFLDQAVQEIPGDDLTQLASCKRASLVKPHGTINRLVPNRGTADEPRTDQWREAHPDDRTAPCWWSDACSMGPQFRIWTSVNAGLEVTHLRRF